MDALFDLNKKLGIHDSELEDFERKATELSNIIAGLKDGTVDPEKARPSWELSEEQIREEKEREELARLEKIRKEKEAAEHEKRSWWERAETLIGKTRSDAAKERVHHIQQLRSGVRLFNKGEQVNHNLGSEKITVTDDDGNILFPKPKVKADVLDYSVWDRWVPDDPVSLEEMKKAKDKIEDERNAAFEAANPEFCKQFRDDQDAREKVRDKKEKDAEKLRLRGNQLFQRKRFSEALKCYMDALQIVPWTSAILCNVALVYLKQNEFIQAQEFCERALFLDNENIKALFRHAKVCAAAGDLEMAVCDLTFASLLDPNNDEVARDLESLKQDLFESRAENNLRNKLGKHEKRIPHSQQNLSVSMKVKGDKETQSYDTLSESLIQILDSAEGQIGAKKSMCAEIANIFPESTNLTPVQLLAVDGLLSLFQGTPDEEERTEMCVLLRNTGALDRLFDLLNRRVGGEPVAKLVVAIIVDSKRNLEMARAYGLFGKVFQSCGSDLGSMRFVLLLSELERFRSEIAIEPAVQKGLKINLSKLEDSAQMFQMTALTICNLGASVTGRNAIEEMVTSDELRVLHKLVSGLNVFEKGKLSARGCIDMREDCAAALANLSMSGNIRSVAQFIAEPLSMALLEGASKNSPACTSFILAALLNLSVDQGNFTREILAKKPILESLWHLLLLKDDKLATSTIQVRASALFSRVIADSSLVTFSRQFSIDHPEAYDSLASILGTDKKSCLSDLSNHLARSIAALCRVSDALPQPVTIEHLCNVLHTHSQLAAEGTQSVVSKSNQGTANLVQIFVFLCSNVKISQLQCFRSKGIPSLVKLLQLCEDGPARKNVAICIAKLAKSSEENMAVVRSLRGMEMLVELGDRLT